MDHTAAGGIQRSLQDILREAIRSSSDIVTPCQNDIATLTKPRTIPPDQLAYFQRLLASLIDGRSFIWVYNYVLLGILTTLTAIHLLDKKRCRRRWQERILDDVSDSEDDAVPASYNPSASSSSTTSSPRITTPSGALKDSQIDIERLPLLGFSQAKEGRSPSAFARSKARLSAWLEYQPPPLPLVHRVLPENGTSLFVVVWLAINIFFHFYKLPLGLKFTLPFAARAGDDFIANLPLLYLLAAKNQPIKLLTGLSYEALNIFHRRVGEWMCFQALVHSVGEALWRLAPGFAPDFFGPHPDIWTYLSRPLIYYGLGAFLSYELLCLTSLGSFRRRCYEVFLASHIVLQILALGFLYKHVHVARPWVQLALLIFLVDRLVWRIGLKSATVDAALDVLPDGETIVLVAEWEPPPPPPPQQQQQRMWWRIWPRQNIEAGWKPTDHVFLTVPALGRAHALQAHPFTIASAAPAAHAARLTLRLLIRAQGGFTAALLSHAHRHRIVAVRLDGPYGSSHALDMLRAADNAVLVAGGSGIAVTLPLAWALLKGAPPARRSVRMLWIIHCEEHRRWVPGEVLEALVAAGLELVVPRPTEEAGRPDVVGRVEEWVDDGGMDGVGGGQSAVVVSGPDGLNRMVRNTCSAAVSRGVDIRLAVEKFGW